MTVLTEKKEALAIHILKDDSALGVPVKHTELTIFLVVAFYWATSLAVVFLNKFILSSSEYKFPYPLTVTWYQLAVALALLLVCGTLGR